LTTRYGTNQGCGEWWTVGFSTSFGARNSRPLSIDPLGNATTNLYDAANRLTETIDPDHNPPSYNRYDPAGNVTASIDPLGNGTTTMYDGMDRVTAVIDPLGNVSSTGYDLAGRVTCAGPNCGRSCSQIRAV
jgi:YD repeat-containing protein